MVHIHHVPAPTPAPGLAEDASSYIRATAITNWHACGTCRMLPLDQGGVVDSRLRLHGVQGLRIVDASVFPLIPDTHIVVSLAWVWDLVAVLMIWKAAVYMVAEKAADMIKEDWRLI